MATSNERNSKTGSPQEKGTVRAVERAFSLLGNFSSKQKSLSLTEMARAADLPLSTTSRLLLTLETARFLRRRADGSYVPGSKLLQIGISALGSVDLREAAEETLLTLAEKTGETVNLAAATEEETVIYLRQVESRHAIRHASWVGRAVPIKGTAIGSAIKNRTNSDGYCATSATLEPEVTAVAAPVLAENGVVLAGLSVTGPSYRFNEGKVAAIGALLVSEAKLLAEKLGHASKE